MSIVKSMLAVQRITQGNNCNINGFIKLNLTSTLLMVFVFLLKRMTLVLASNMVLSSQSLFNLTLPLCVWEPHGGTGVNILSENGQYPHNSSYEAPCLP